MQGRVSNYSICGGSKQQAQTETKYSYTVHRHFCMLWSAHEGHPLQHWPQVQDLLALLGVSHSIQQCRSASCIMFLVEPWSRPGHAAQDDGVRMLADVHKLHNAYKQLLTRIDVAHVALAGPVDT